MSDRQLKSYQKLQRKLFHEAHRLVKNDGVLVFSTCSVRTEENNDNVKYFLEKYSDLICEKIVYFNPFELKNKTISGIVHIESSGKTDTIGFFCARFRKKIS